MSGVATVASISGASTWRPRRWAASWRAPRRRLGRTVVTRRTTCGDDDLFVVPCGAGLVKTISGDVHFTFRSGGSISDGGPVMRTLLSATLPTCVCACYMQRRNKERGGLDQSFTFGEGELRVHVAAAELLVRRLGCLRLSSCRVDASRCVREFLCRLA